MCATFPLQESDRPPDKNQVENNGASPLLVAAAYGHLAVVELLVVEKGDDVNKVTNSDLTPLHVATTEGRADVISFLMNRGASLTLRYFQGNLPIDMTTNETIKQLIRDEEKRRNEGSK